MNSFRKQCLGASFALGLALVGAPLVAQPQPVLEAPGHGRSPSPEGVRFIPTLYDQTDNASGGGFTSQNFEKAYDANDAQGADDFVVPAGQVWGLTQIYIPGSYGSTGPAASVDVFVYKNQIDSPGEEIHHAAAIVPGDSAGDLSIVLPSPLLLFAGTYWLSVRVNMDFDSAGQWFWSTRSVQSGYTYHWRNPGDGFGTGCTSWAAGCISPSAPDTLFALLGYASTGFACNNPPQAFGSVPPADWSVESAVPGGAGWATIAGAGLAGNYTGGSGGAASVSSDAVGEHAFDARLHSKAFSLIGAHSASVRYLANYQNFAGADVLNVDISTNGGTAWANLLSWNEDHGAFKSATGEEVEIDLEDQRTFPFLILRWRYVDLNPNAWAWYAQIDDVRIECFPFFDGFEGGNSSRWSRTAP